MGTLLGYKFSGVRRTTLSHDPIGKLKNLTPSLFQELRKNWARLIQKIYEVDPLTCPKCSGTMKVISVIKDEEIVKKILMHLGLWDRKARPPSGTRPGTEKTETIIDDSFSQLPASDKWLAEGHVFSVSGPEYPETFPV